MAKKSILSKESSRNAYKVADALMNGCTVVIGVKDGEQVFSIIHKRCRAVFRFVVESDRWRNINVVVTVPKSYATFDNLLKKFLGDEEVREHLRDDFGIILDTENEFFVQRTREFFTWHCNHAGIDVFVI